MNFQELAVKRYSVRNFRQTPIPKAVIEQILMAGNAAPTAHNNLHAALAAQIEMKNAVLRVFPV